MGEGTYRSLKIPGGAGIYHRRNKRKVRHRTRKQRGRGATANFFKNVANGAGKAILRQGVNNLGNIVNALGAHTKQAS